MSNQTKLPDNLPFAFNIIHITTVSKILEIQITLISEARGAKDAVVVEVHYSLLFKISDLPSSPTCAAYGMDFPFLSSIRVYFV